MKPNKHSSVSGIRIESTLSMAVQNRNHQRHPIHLLVIALCGAIGSICTFLSMFEPLYHALALIISLSAVFVCSAFLAHSAGRFSPFRVGFVTFYAIILYLLREPFSAGFAHLVNTIYKVIYMTEWERFATSAELSPEYCTTVFLILAFCPILYMLCYAVLHFQNLFLSLIATFPFVEIGFYFGVPANRFSAILLLSFWFSMAAVHLANSGAYHGKGTNSFLRRDNTFFPISSMRFMVTEKIGIQVLAGTMAVCLAIWQVLDLTGYQRSDDVKILRREVQDHIAALMSGEFFEESELWKSVHYETHTDDRVVVTLGKEDKREFEDISLSGLWLSAIPEGRLYLKYCVGEIYSGNTWSIPEESVYETEIFDLFEQTGYYPQEFLYGNVSPFSSHKQITMEFLHVTELLSKCLPYGFAENDAVAFNQDNRASEFASTYEIVYDQNYEDLLLESSQFLLTGEEIHPSLCRPEQQAAFRTLLEEAPPSVLQFTVPPGGYAAGTSASLEASLLCHYGYKEYVLAQDLQIPDTPAMQHVREAYAPLLNSFSYQTASASEIIAFMQELRETVCGSMSYTLAPGRTPPAEDFVEFFLLKNQKGYCMHYATAGVLLARMAGIPARYCEGYMVDPDENNIIETMNKDGSTAYTFDVLDSNAHAWVELYIDGWGWVPFEFTFADSAQLPPVETEPPTETVTSVVTSYVQQTAPPTEQTAVQTETAIGTQPQDASKPAVLRGLLTALGILLAAALVIGTVYGLRILALRKRQRLFAQTDRTAAVQCVYSYLCSLLAYCGADVNASRTAEIVENAERACGKYLPEGSLEMAVSIAAKAKFSKHTISEAELQQMLRTVSALADGITQKASFWQKFRLKYILHLV